MRSVWCSALALASGLASSGCTQAERQFGNGGAGGGGGAATSSSSTSSSSTSSSSTSSSSTSSSSSGGGTEVDCTNGVDDDNDGYTDCEDTDCTVAGFQCAQPAPQGWSGPAALYAGVGAPPECGPDWTSHAVVGGLDVSSPTAGCSACSCKSPVGVGCDGGAQVTISTNSACQDGPLFLGFGQCGPSTQGSFASVAPPKALGGACGAVGGAPNLPPADFKTQAAVCADPVATGGGCSAGACVAKAPNGYGPSLCIFAQGDVTCPSGPYNKRTVVFGAIDDQRGCSACACDAPAGAVCQTTFLAFNSIFPGNCLGTPNTFPASGQCFNVGGAQYTSVVVNGTGTATGGSCSPSGGSPTGAADGAQPSTVCCQ